MTEVLDKLLKKSEMLNIVSFTAGEKRNAIPSKAQVLFAVDDIDWNDTLALLSDLANRFQKEGGKVDPNINITAVESEVHPEEMLSNESTLRLLSLLKSLPHGLIKWNADIEGLPQTSTNLAKVRLDKSQIKIQMMSRSSVEAELDDTRDQIKKTSLEYGAKVRQSSSYTGWKPDLENPLLPVLNAEWEKITGNKIITEATHGGLECGVIMGKYPHLRAVSIGPTIQKAHEEGEQVNILSVSRFYPFLRNTISAVAQQNS